MRLRYHQLGEAPAFVAGDLVAIEKMDGDQPVLRKMERTDFVAALFGVLTEGIPLTIDIDGTPTVFTLKTIIVEGGPVLAFVPES